MYRYNYRLAVGTIGTNDECLASIFYNINRLETTDEPSKLRVIMTDSEYSWQDYANKNNVPADTVAFINQKIKEAFDFLNNEPKEARKKIQRILPPLLDLDGQSSAANKVSSELGHDVSQDEEENRSADYQFYIGEKGLMRKNMDGSNKICLYPNTIGIHYYGDYLENHSIVKIDGQWVFFNVYVQSRERDEDDPYTDSWWETHSTMYKIKIDGTGLSRV